MKLILVGCEYSGTTTLAFKIREWVHEVIGGYINLVHDHFKIPYTVIHSPTYTDTPESTIEEQEQFLALTPRTKEAVQRHNVVYHVGGFEWQVDRIVVGFYIEDAIYGPHYFGYGGGGERQRFAQSIERKLMSVAPETVLGLVKASPEVIARRMRENPRQNGVLQAKDIEYILGRFAEEHAASRIRHKITLDTTMSTVEETVADFVKQIESHLTDNDRTRIILQQVWRKDGITSER